LGSSLVRELKKQGYSNLITVSRSELDLCDLGSTKKFLQKMKPDAVISCAAKVGGIKANSNYPAEFIRDNLLIETSVIEASYSAGVRQLVFVSSSCVYPKDCPQPMNEGFLQAGPVEDTNYAYAQAKLAGMSMCRAYSEQYGLRYFSVIPASLYGPNDNFDLESSHVLPALIHRFHIAREQNQPEINLWGSGKPRREFMYVDDGARAIILALQKYSQLEALNIGTGEDCEIREVAEIIKGVVGYKGQIKFDSTKADGILRKLVDSTKISNLGFKTQISLLEGIKSTYDWFCLEKHVRGKS